MNTQSNAVPAVSPVPSSVVPPAPAAPKFKLRLRQPDFWNTPSPAMEEKLLAYWEQMNLRDAVAQRRAGAPKYWLLDGPPYANGEAHLGHLLNKTLKDVNARFQNATGNDVVWRAGWDCHGLPLELAVEKRHGPSAKANPAEFMRACRDEAATWQQSQAKGMHRLGLMANLDTPWRTMDPEREASSLGLLKELWEAGLLVERHSPVHWCPACQSALAASELEVAEKSRKEAFFLAELDANSLVAMKELTGFSGKRLHLVVWTTTPWTLWANAAFAYPRAGAGVLAELATGQSVLMAEPAWATFVLRYPELLAPRTDCETAPPRFLFEQLPSLSLKAVSPLSKRLVPLLPAEFASAEEGTGFVHVAPAYGPEDFSMHEAEGVRLELHVGPNGRLVSSDPALPLPVALEGLTLEAATEESCRMLEGDGLLVWAFDQVVEVQTCWRHKKPVFYRASQQWALDLHKGFEGCPEGLAARATAALESTQFLPDNRAKTPLATMLATRRFWTLSRDRLWGLPLPFFRREKTGALHPDTGLLWSQLVDQVRTRGVEAWQAFPVPDGYVKTSQTVDVWFDSGAAWHSASELGRHQPDLGVEGRDQTRGWFLSSFLLHAFKSPEPAFKALMTHSFVVGEDGRKLSKSEGGAKSKSGTPAAVFTKDGADVFRLWVCAQNVGDEVKWSRASLEQATQDLKDWRSFLRFILANMEPTPGLPQPECLRPLDLLALSRAAEARDAWLEHMAAGRFNLAMQSLNSFRLWASTDWFELNKRTLYCARDANPKLKSVQWALQQVFVLFSCMLSPVVPFAAEEAYLAWPQHPDASVFAGTVPLWSVDEDAASDWVRAALTWRRAVLPLVEKGRGLVAKGVPVALGFGGKVPFGLDEDDLREWFPTTYPRAEGSADHFEECAEDSSLGVVAGRAASAYAPYRCARCRGYFAARLSAHGMCSQCVAEES